MNDEIRIIPYQTKVDAHFQLYVNYVAYLKAAGQL